MTATYSYINIAFVFQLHWASSPAAVLDRLAGIDVESILPNLGINHPANAFTTDHAPHVVFARLESWLTPSVVRHLPSSPLLSSPPAL